MVIVNATSSFLYLIFHASLHSKNIKFLATSKVKFVPRTC